MNAAKIARNLKMRGLTIKSVAEGSAHEDGMVEITALVHVQVPTFGSRVNVVAECDGGESFQFYPERRASDLDGLVDDIRKACGLEA